MENISNIRKILAVLYLIILMILIRTIIVEGNINITEWFLPAKNLQSPEKYYHLIVKMILYGFQLFVFTYLPINTILFTKFK